MSLKARVSRICPQGRHRSIRGQGKVTGEIRTEDGCHVITLAINHPRSSASLGFWLVHDRHWAHVQKVVLLAGIDHKRINASLGSMDTSNIALDGSHHFQALFICSLLLRLHTNLSIEYIGPTFLPYPCIEHTQRGTEQVGRDARWMRHSKTCPSRSIPWWQRCRTAIFLFIATFYNFLAALLGSWGIDAKVGGSQVVLIPQMFTPVLEPGKVITSPRSIS